MALELINIGQVANDGTGDDLREAFIKINQNFEELDLRDDEKTTVSNIGAIGQGLFAKKIGYDLQFKKIAAGKDITLNATDDQIFIDADGGLKSLLLSTDSGSRFLEENAALNIQGGANISVSLVGDTLTIDHNGFAELSNDTTPELGGNLNGGGFNISNVDTINALNFNGSFTGNLTGLVYGIDIRNLDNTINKSLVDFDFGLITQNITSLLEWIVKDVEVDLGGISNPDLRVLDFGGY